ncbi:MAG: DUF4394 domain-containing protein [Blastocatellia bacterium]
MNVRKSSAALATILLALTVSLIFGLGGSHSAGAENGFSPSRALLSSAAGFVQDNSGIVLPSVNIYVLATDNSIYVLTPGSSKPTRLGRPGPINGNLIGIDFRPADGSLYGLADNGNLYTIDLASPSLNATLVSAISPRFAGGVQSLADFNPVANALRVIGSNDQNFAVVNSNGGNLNATAVQTAMAYAAGDVNAGVNPNISGGSYTNNVAGAANTLFYGVDYDLDTFVTIAPPLTANGSSNTGGGQLQTIGSLSDAGGNPINLTSTADLDIFTTPEGVNILIGVSGLTLFTIDLSQINPSLAVGTTQKVVARTATLPLPVGDVPPTGVLIDIAVSTAAPAANPAPSPSPAISPVVPIVECVRDNGNGSFTARFGYNNPNATTVTIPYGNANRFVPGQTNPTHPTTFLPGRQRKAFSMKSNSVSLAWVLNGRTATALLNHPTRCTP